MGLGLARMLLAAAALWSVRASEHAATPDRVDQRIPATAAPLPASLTGRIAFQSDVSGRPAIYVLDLPAGHVRLVSGSPGWTETNPRWSPDGRWLVIASNRAHYEGRAPESGTPDSDLWLVAADGSSRRRLTTEPANEADPEWAPDGRHVIYSSDKDSRGDLYRIAIDDGSVTRLTRHHVGRAIMPAASAGRVAFGAQTLRLGAFWSYEIHVLDETTGRTTTVSDADGGCWPRWSRSGRQLAYVEIPSRGPSRLAVRDADGGAIKRLHTPAPLWSYYPAWSPDDSRIAFSVSPEHHEGEDWDLAVIDPATGVWTRLTRGPGNDRLPDWTR